MKVDIEKIKIKPETKSLIFCKRFFSLFSFKMLKEGILKIYNEGIGFFRIIFFISIIFLLSSFVFFDIGLIFSERVFKDFKIIENLYYLGFVAIFNVILFYLITFFLNALIMFFIFYQKLIAKINYVIIKFFVSALFLLTYFVLIFLIPLFCISFIALYLN